PASLNESLFRSNRDRKIAASMGSLKQYRTYAAHSSSTYMSNLPAYDSRKFTISLSSVSCRRGSTTWYGHSASSFCSQALRLSGSMVNLFSITTQRQIVLCPFHFGQAPVNENRQHGQHCVKAGCSTNVRFIPGKRTLISTVMMSTPSRKPAIASQDSHRLRRQPNRG